MNSLIDIPALATNTYTAPALPPYTTAHRNLSFGVIASVSMPFLYSGSQKGKFAAVVRPMKLAIALNKSWERSHENRYPEGMQGVRTTGRQVPVDYDLRQPMLGIRSRFPCTNQPIESRINNCQRHDG